MFCKNYDNFVRSAFLTEVNNSCNQKNLTGDEARKLYLEEVSDIKVKNHQLITVNTTTAEKIINRNNKRSIDTVNISNKDLFLSVQNNDVITVKRALDNSPDKINVVDQFGWSLLMIACQANATETVIELLKRGINTSIRDKAGHSAQSLVIKNKNYILADIILTHKPKRSPEEQLCLNNKEKGKINNREDFFSCKICSNEYPDRQEHISSTIHNMNASKGRKIPTSYVLPHTNKGYQIMLKTGWDKDTGLGKDGSGNKYPLRTEQKKDRKGLGHKKKNKEISEKLIEHKSRKRLAWDNYKNRKMEINFRRQFY